MSRQALLRARLDPLSGEDAATRTEFATWLRATRMPQVRYIALLTAALYLLYAVIEQLVTDDAPVLRSLGHVLLVPGMLLAVAALSLRASRQSWMWGVLMVSPLVANAINLSLNIAGPQFLVFAPEIYLSIIWTFAISGLPLRQAFIAALGIVALAVGATLQLEADRAWTHLLWVFSAFSFGGLSAFFLEAAHKSIFLRQRQLAHSAKVDPLTSLWNRAYVERLFENEQARAERYEVPFSVMLIDIDYFKMVNDTYGHSVGDKVIRQFAELLRQGMRRVDEIGRIGGEEFFVLLPQTRAQQAEASARDLLAQINAFEFDTVGRRTASFGVTEYRAGERRIDTFNRVDRALYAAKAKGRNCIEVL